VRARAALLTICGVVLGGCWAVKGEHEEDTFACDRGFRASDWRQAPLRTGQSIAKCDWLEGWSARKVRETLGRPDFHTTPRRLAYPLAISEKGLGPLQWYVMIVLDRPRGTVVDARARLVSY
jgi:hypothetical protein